MQSALFLLFSAADNAPHAILGLRNLGRHAREESPLSRTEK